MSTSETIFHNSIWVDDVPFGTIVTMTRTERGSLKFCRKVRHRIFLKKIIWNLGKVFFEFYTVSYIPVTIRLWIKYYTLISIYFFDWSEKVRRFKKCFFHIIHVINIVKILMLYVIMTRLRMYQTWQNVRILITYCRYFESLGFKVSIAVRSQFCSWTD